MNIDNAQMAGHAPCKDCTDRIVNCHSKCERYSAWKAKVKECAEIRKKALSYSEYRNDKITKEESKMCKSSKEYKERFKG